MGHVRPTLRLTPEEALIFLRGLDATGCFPAPLATPERAAWIARNGPARRIVLPVEDAATWLQGLFAVSLAQQVLSGPDRPRLRDCIRSGRIRYVRSDPDEAWQTWAEILNTGSFGGDCEDLATAWAAEMVADGWDPDARPVVYRSSPRLSHVVVWSPRNQAYIDPSRLAGMGRE